MWQAVWVALEDPERLRRELDQLQAAGISVVRITAASEGVATAPLQVVPTLQPRPGAFSERVAVAIDLVLAELRARRMRAIMTLSNQWSWSGGFATFLVWSRRGSWRDIPYPAPDGYWQRDWGARGAGRGGTPHRPDASWDEYQKWAASFYTDAAAMGYFRATAAFLLNRSNTHTAGRIRYADDPTVLAWELANEPRAVSANDPEGTRRAYLRWVDDASAEIKQMAPHQLVTVGSEGATPFESYVNADFDATHRLPHIDLITIHIWPQNWGWGDASSAASYEKALTASLAYLDDHVRRAQAIGKPLVVEEFGLARDGQRTDAGGGVERRNAYYGAVGRRASQLGVSGVLPWAWSGEGRPHRPGGYWVAGDAFTGDPPHEPQGWYGILDTDESTLRLLRQMAQAFQHAG